MNAAAAREHATTEELALYVIAALEPPARRRLEGHVATCAACASALQAEAAAEEALIAILPAARANAARPLAAVVPLPRVAARAEQPAATPARRPARGGSFAITAAAAAVVLMLGFVSERGRSGSAEGQGALSSIAACYALPSDMAGGEGEPLACAPEVERRGSLAALACWGMCGRPAQPHGPAICGLPEDAVCSVR